MQELQNKVIKWAEDKGIFAKSDPTSQFLKTISEVGELADAVNKNDLPEIKDAIGDTYVTMIIFSRMMVARKIFGEINPPMDEDTVKKDILWLSCVIGTCANAIYQKTVEIRDLNGIDNALARIAIKYGWTAKECVQSAYDVISKRTGKMENGVFIKDA